MPDPKESRGVHLVHGIDYYLEGGNMVFTPKFLLQRGYCCNSGCRHCPYMEGGLPKVAVEVVGEGRYKERGGR